jgi:hypothetical protein
VRILRKLSAILLGALVVFVAATTAFAATTDTSTLVNAGSPPTPFPQNKQNEPALAVDASHPAILVSGSNDELDLAPCNLTKCPFTPGVGVSGVYFSSDSGKTWTQPTYTGWTGRDCAPDMACTTHVGSIGTLPWYYENGLVSDGDPALAFGPRRDSNGHFSWASGSRLYYANMTSNFSSLRSEEAFGGYEAIAVSRTDDVVAAAGSDDKAKSAWMPPVLVSKQSSTTFSDKEQIWADNAVSSRFFGSVYVCWADFRSNGLGGAPAPMQVAVSRDGGDTWTQQQVTPAANNTQRNPMDGCTVRTDSKGNAYVFGVGSFGGSSFEYVSISTDGGASWSKQRPVVGPVTQPGVFDSILGRPTIDGIAGARSDLAVAPSVDIANGAPSGTDATNQIVMTYVSGSIDKQHVYFTQSTDGAATWSTPTAIETQGDYGYYAAPAISPNGTDVYVVYNAFTTPYQTDTSTPRLLVGVMLHAVLPGRFQEINRGAAGDARGSSQNNLRGEFLGDYVYAVATRTYGAAVWNDARNADDCPAMDDYRMALRTGDTTVPRPSVLTDCTANYGNSDIYGYTSYAPAAPAPTGHR